MKGNIWKSMSIVHTFFCKLRISFSMREVCAGFAHTDKSQSSLLKWSTEKQQRNWPPFQQYPCTAFMSTGCSPTVRIVRLTFEKAVFAVDHIDPPPLQAGGAVQLAVVLVKTSIGATHGHKRSVAPFLAHALDAARYIPDHTLPAPATVRPPARTLVWREKRLKVKINIVLCTIRMMKVKWVDARPRMQLNKDQHVCKEIAVHVIPENVKVSPAKTPHRFPDLARVKLLRSGSSRRDAVGENSCWGHSPGSGPVHRPCQL